MNNKEDIQRNDKNQKLTFEEVIQRDGNLIYTCVGISMLPLIHQKRDLVIIEKPSGRLKKYDVVLYKRKNGSYVLHRILNVRNDDYIICGDNQYRKEYGITDNQIIGVLSELIRNGKTVSISDWRYRVYVHLWCDLFYIRVIGLRFLAFLRKLKRYISKKKVIKK